MIRVFPIAGGTTFSNDWGDGRSGGRSHQGNDLHARMGDPIVAVDDGYVRSGVDPLGGNIVNLYAADGTRYYYAHLSAYATADGSRVSYAPAQRGVRTGDLIGFVGNTGNAAQTDPHVHFEVHPGNGPAVNPYPMLLAAPRVTPNQLRAPASSNGSRDLVRPILGVALAASAAWLLLNPVQAQRLARRLGVAR